MKRILVVDSDEQVASILSLKLNRGGFEAASAGNSADALKIIPDFRPDLIVSETIHGIFQARVLEWNAIAFSERKVQALSIS